MGKIRYNLGGVVNEQKICMIIVNYTNPNILITLNTKKFD